MNEGPEIELIIVELDEIEMKEKGYVRRTMFIHDILFREEFINRLTREKSNEYCIIGTQMGEFIVKGSYDDLNDQIKTAKYL